MGIFDGIMILSDLDGTLLDRGELPLRHLEAVHYFVDNGGAFCPATGRPEGFLFENFPCLPLQSYCIVKNGTAIYDCRAKKYIWHKSLGMKVIDRAIHLLDKFPRIEAVTLHTADKFYSIKKSEGQMQQRLRSVTDEPFKIVFWMLGAHEGADYCEQFGDYQYVCSSDHLLEVMAKETGKGVCVDKLRSVCKNVKCFVGVGDYENDISLLDSVDIAVAVDGGFPPLKNHADWIAPPIKEYPIAWLVEKLQKELEAGRIL